MGEEKAKPAGVWPIVKPFVNGGAFGILATCVIQPIDMIKVRIQLGKGSVSQVTRTMLKNEGIRAFYKSSHFGVALVHKALSITVLQGDSYGMDAVGIIAGVESTKNYVADKDEWLGFFTENLFEMKDEENSGALHFELLIKGSPFIIIDLKGTSNGFKASQE
ncbi:hypothetical protein RJ639_012506 [Escallonia herrerae]|uniref:Uncharacterized protein n=1 Tax=Escallonia herrerae TaxID=1293975 RepID=A0AA89AQZ8_9ASTE|nr:hypothetical protein RJ639_012506 [Escallonia herrerae]